MNYRNEDWYQRMDPESRARYDRAQDFAASWNAAARKAGKKRTRNGFLLWCLAVVVVFLMGSCTVVLDKLGG